MWGFGPTNNFKEKINEYISSRCKSGTKTYCCNTHTVFAGPGRIVGLYINKEKNLAQSTVTLQDDSTTVATFKVRATDNTNGGGMNEYILFPGTGIKCSTNNKITIADTVTFCTIIFG